MKKITVISPSFDYKSKAEQQDFVYNLLPEDWKSKVIIQIQSSGQRIKREVGLNILLWLIVLIEDT